MIFSGVVPRWWRNRTGRPLSPPQIHQKINSSKDEFTNSSKEECWATATKQLLNTGRGHQAPRKAVHSLWKEGCDYWLDCSLPFWLFLLTLSLQVISIFLPSPSLLYLTLWISLGVPDCGEHIGNSLLVRLLSPLLTPPLLLLVTSISSVFSSPCKSVNLSGWPSL